MLLAATLMLIGFGNRTQTQTTRCRLAASEVQQLDVDAQGPSAAAEIEKTSDNQQTGRKDR